MIYPVGCVCILIILLSSYGRYNRYDMLCLSVCLRPHANVIDWSANEDEGSC